MSFVMRHKESLSFETAQKMIAKLLTCSRIIKNVNVHEYKEKPYTKNQLAARLFLSPKQISELAYEDFYTRNCEMLSLPLIKLFCATKFYEENK